MIAVQWLPEALQDVQRLHGFLHEKHPVAAARAVAAIRDGAALLAVSPEIGRPMGDGRREWLIPFAAGTYMLRYRYEASVVVVIRVWHSRERAD